MRPQRIRRGERRVASVPRTAGRRPASMRPQRIRRGERLSSRGSDCNGHGPLQCGHSEFAVENQDNYPGCLSLLFASSPSFNAATANSPWRTMFTDKLRWRPQRWQRHGFNAATANSPWRTWVCRRGPTTSLCFNAATANSPWRTSSKRGSDRESHSASMRPQRIRRGELRVYTVATVIVSERQGAKLSMRPQRIRRGERRSLPYKTTRGSSSFNACGHSEFAVENTSFRTGRILPT